MEEYGILKIGRIVIIYTMFKSCHILLIEAPKIRHMIKFTPRVPNKADFVPPLT
jgi:hypothetical protein